jgi:methylmalonyl-CoA mutase
VTPDGADLTEGFERPTREQWLALTARSLKGAAFETLVSRTSDGLEIQPLYSAEDSPARIAANFGEPAGEGPWDIRARIDQADPAAANSAALDDLGNGANSLLLRLDATGRAGCAIGSAADMARVLEGVVIEAAPVALDAGLAGPQAAAWLSEAAKGSPSALLAFHLDPLTAFAEAGATPGPVEAHIARAATTGARLSAVHPKATLFLASGRAVHEAGGSEAQELGFAAAAALAYAKALVEAGLDMAQAFAAIQLGVSVDGDYFISIAKLRAARAIWDRMAQACGVAVPARIEARSSQRMLAALDAWTNLLRLTASGFAAAAGGADAIALAPFTDPLGAPTAFARRQARNIQLVLMEESHLGRVRDPAAGSWYVESLSHELAEQGWGAFQAIERAGGAAAALSSGLIAANVAGAAAAGATAAAHAHPGQVGVSRFPDLAGAPVPVEPPAKGHCAEAPDVRLPGADSACPALAPRRLSEPFEAARARAEALQPAPAADLVILGRPGDSTARVGVARNLLACAGVRLAVARPEDAPAPIAVVAGSDDMLAAEGIAAVAGLKAKGALVLVAAPAHGHDALRQAGAHGFLHTGLDAVALAADLLAHLEGRLQ